jgi:chromosomal replication initiator protein
VDKFVDCYFDDFFSTIYVILILKLWGREYIMNFSKLNSLWEEVLLSLKNKLQDNNIFNTFFQDSKLDEVEGDTAYISVTTRFAKELIESRYLELIEITLEEVSKSIFHCVITIANNTEINRNTEKKNEYESFTSNLSGNYTFENFVVGPSNQEAQSAALTAALEPGKFYNPLFIYGKSGIGKTHLLHAIGNYIRFKSGQETKVYYISSADFLDDYVNAIRDNTINELKESFKQMDVLLIDDIQFLSGKDKTNEMFFHIFNHLINNRKQIVITSDRSPNELKGLEERLVSRFASGLSVSIQNPEFETSLEILKKKVENQNISTKVIKEDVLSYIALKYSKDIRQLEGALNRLVFYAESFKKQTKIIDLDLAQEALKGLIVNQTVNNNALTIDKIKMAVADYYKISTSQLSASIRVSNISNARHIAMYLCRSLLDVPFIKIGDEFGGRDHSTVINACEKVEKLLKNDPNFKQAIDDIKILLK